MLRLLTALLLALLCHGLLLTLPYTQNRDVPPRLPGEETIRVTLGGDLEAKTEPDDREMEEKEPVHSPEVVNSPLERKPPPAREEIPPQATTPQKNSAAPVALKAGSRKKYIETAAVTPTPSVNRPQQKLPAKAVYSASVQTTDTGQRTTVAIVKATPLYSRNPKPEYPPLARRRHHQGTVLLSVLVSTSGSVDRVAVHTGSGYSLLDKSAIRTVRNWRFLPGMEDGRPVPMEVIIPVHFQLTD